MGRIILLVEKIVQDVNEIYKNLKEIILDIFLEK